MPTAREIAARTLRHAIGRAGRDLSESAREAKRFDDDEAALPVLLAIAGTHGAELLVLATELEAALKGTSDA